MSELVLGTWSWYVAGPIIALIMFLLVYSGKTFGFSSNFRTICTMSGAGRINEFFNISSKKQYWNLAFLIGSIIGGFIAFTLLSEGDTGIDLNSATVEKLEGLGFKDPGATFLPTELFGTGNMSSVSGLFLLLVGGFLVGFGARYAGGCTSGHAITGLSNLQLPSLIAVVGFFIGGLVMVHLIMPLILKF